MKKRFYFLLFILPLLSGCCRVSLNPSRSYEDVKQNVLQRTGQEIYWQNHDPEFIYCLESYLEHPLTFEDMVQITLLNNYKLQAAYQLLGVAQAQVVQAHLLKNPLFGLSLRYENLVKGANIIEMGLVQNILDILLKPVKIRLARIEREQVKQEIAGLVIETIAEAKMAYIHYQTSRHILDMKKQLLEAAEASFDGAKRLRQAGNLTELFLVQQQSLYEEIKIDVSEWESIVYSARQDLNTLMGLWGCFTHWEAAGSLPEVTEVQYDLDEVERCALENSLNLQIKKEEIRATAARYKIQTAETVFPEMFLGPDSEKEADNTWYVGPAISLAIPIFDTGKARISEGHFEVARLCNEYIDLAINIRASARKLAFNLNQSYFQYDWFEKALIPISETTTTQALLQVNAMQIGVFELLDMKKKEIMTKQRAFSYYEMFWRNKAELERLISGKFVES
ncbi:MAG: TolC family protein [Chlamydiales bacterium]